MEHTNAQKCFPGERIKNGAIFLVSLAFFGVLGFWFPYVSDDWAWGSAIGLRRLQIWFQNYNGRYAGNLLVLVLTRSRYLRAMVMAISCFGVCWLCGRFSGERNGTGFLISLVLFLCMPREMLREAIAWTAGFANYFPSAWISLFFVLHGSRRILEGCQKTAWLLNGALFLLAFLGGLFIEHITVFHIVWSMGLLIGEKKRIGKMLSSEVWMLAGALLAAVCMFSNPLYWNALLGKNTYQRIAHTLSSFLFVLGSNGLRGLKSLVIDNSILCCIASVLLLTLYFQRKGACTPGQRRLAGQAMAVNIACLTMIVALKIIPERWMWIIQGVFAIFYGISLLVVLVICAEKAKRKRLLLPLACLVAASFPLLFVSPIGPRCFFLAYLLLMVFLLELLGCVQDQWEPKKKSMGMTRVLCPVLLAQMIALLCIFHTIYRYDQMRIDSARMQSEAGEKTIVVCELPFAEYVHMPSVEKELWCQRFKLFYGLNADAEVYAVSPEAFDSLRTDADRQ